ncbi:MAG: FG-GAP-like repeat-containing protein [Acidobacteriota bacterium]
MQRFGTPRLFEAELWVVFAWMLSSLFAGQLETGHVASAQEIALGVVETLEVDDRRVAIELETVRGSLPEGSLILERTHRDFARLHAELEAGRRQARNILVGWTGQRSLHWALVGTLPVVTSPAEHSGSGAGLGPCLVVTDDAMGPQTPCAELRTQQLLDGLRTAVVDDTPLPTELATPLFLGRLFFLRPSDHRRLVDGWTDLIVSSERRVPESLVFALAHPLLLEQLEAQRRDLRSHLPGVDAATLHNRLLEVEWAVERTREALSAESGRHDLARYRLDRTELSHAGPEAPASRLLIGRSDGVHEHTYPPGTRIVRRATSDAHLIVQFPQSRQGAAVWAALEQVDLDSGELRSVIRDGVSYLVEGVPDGFLVSVRAIEDDASQRSPDRLELIVSAYDPERRSWDHRTVRSAWWLPDWNTIRAPWEPDPPRRVYVEGHVLFVATDESGAEFERFDLTSFRNHVEVSNRRSPQPPILTVARLDPADEFKDPPRVVRSWHGDGHGAGFGWRVRNIGDVDADGVADFATSAPHRSVSDTSGSGWVAVYSTRGGQRLWSRRGRPGDRLGFTLAAAGDVDGDGTPDVIAGAPGGDRVEILAGATGTPLHVFESDPPGRGFGRSVAGVGDVDADGHADLLISETDPSPSPLSPGRALLFSGRAGSILRQWLGEERHWLGEQVAGVAPARKGPYATGVPHGGPGQTGRILVFSGLDDQPRLVLDSAPSGGFLGGHSLAILGDVDADGVADLYAADIFRQQWVNYRIVVYSGADGRELHSVVGNQLSERHGLTAADAGDVDFDGHDDFLVGGMYGPDCGKVLIYSGRTGDLIQTWPCLLPAELDATAMGDVDGDGWIELLVGSSSAEVDGEQVGRVLLISTRPSR